MKRLALSALCGVLLFCLTSHASAETVTEGRLDIQNLASQIAGDLQDYAEKRDTLIENIKSAQNGIQKLKEDHDRAETEKEKIHIKARTLRETGRLVSFYSQFFNLNVDKVEAILPALEKMRASAKKGAMGKTARILEDPEFKKSMKNLYVNLATLATKFDNADLKKEIASLLKENELLYQQNRKGVRAFDDIVRNIDKVADYMRSVYARTVLRARILEHKKLQTEMAVELMEYALALQPIQEGMMQLNPESVLAVPALNLSDFVDSILSGKGGEGADDALSYQDPDVEAALKRLQQGPKFLR